MAITGVRHRCAVLIVLMAMSLAACSDTSAPEAPRAGSVSAPGSPGAQSPVATEPDATESTDLVQRIRDYVAKGSVDLRSIRAVVVTRDGRVAAEYYHRSSAAEHVEVQSVTKSVISTLIGIALARGEITSVDDDLGSLLPQLRAAMSPAASKVTLRQLLTMTSGWTDDTDSQPSKPGLVDRVLGAGPQQPLGQFVYANTPVQLLSAILVKATGISVLAYARRELFDPLGIVSTPAYEGRAADVDAPDVVKMDQFRWLRDPDGLHAAPFGLALTASDMSKIGQLWLDGGRWDDRQLLPAGYVAAATSNQVPALDQTRTGYGYLWWDTPLSTHPAFSALGQYGQLITVVPDLRTVVVVSSRASDTPPTPDDLRALVDDAVVANLR